MQLGFAIDHRKCIGCHACTVACKAENDVPLGSFRTWVKYVDKGAFPAVRRHFTVLRCNHCDRAPCVTICPVAALHKRPDAIVDLDRDVCIGCRACMQACPYDALYFNDERGVTEKCHYCAHRTELGLEPACVVVCPTQAIVAGDAGDPTSRLAALLAEQPVSRRKPEKRTEPRVWYVDALPEALVPGTAAEPPLYLWSERRGAPPPAAGHEPQAALVTSLDVAHPPAWGAHVWAYLWTKNVAAGAALVSPFLSRLGVAPGRGRDYVPEVVALAFLALTACLLVHDLGRPERAWRLLLAPHTRSWLVRGAWVLAGFGAVTALGLGLRLAGLATAADALRWANMPAAALASGYSAWLFAQCQGRDLWLERGLFGRLVLRAALLGSLVALLLGRAASARVEPAHATGVLAVAAAWVAFREQRRPPAGADARRAHALMARALGRGQPALLLAGAAILALALAPAAGAPLAADIAVRVAIVVLAGVALLVHERAWILAGQEVPLS